MIPVIPVIPRSRGLALPCATVERRWSSRLVERGWLIAAAALIAYAALASPYIVDGDNAELSALGALGGRATIPS